MGDKRMNIVIGAKDAASGRIKDVEGSLGSLESKILAVGAAYLSWEGAKSIFSATISAAADEEEQINRLRNSIELTGDSWIGSKDKIDRFIESMQSMTRYGDDQTRPVLQQIITLTGDVDKGMEGTKLAADLAASVLFDMQTAARYVAMAMEGNVEMLGRYIPELRASAGLIDSNMTATEKWTIAQKLLQKRVGGMATGEMNAFNTEMESLANYVGDIGETLGYPFLDFLTNAASGLRDAAKELRDFVTDLTTFTPEYIKQQREKESALQESQKNMMAALQSYTDFETDIRTRSFEEMKEIMIKEYGRARGGSDKYFQDEITKQQEWLGKLLDGRKEYYKQALEDKIEADTIFAYQDAIAKQQILEATEELYNELLGEGFTEEQLESMSIFKALFPADAKEEAEAAIEEIGDNHEELVIKSVEGLGIWELKSTQATIKMVQDHKKATKFIGSDWDKMTRESQMAVTAFSGAASMAISRASDNIVDIMYGGKNRLKDIFKDMARDFITLFIEEILKSVKLALVAKLISLLKLFDVRENDMMAMQMGRDYAMYFQMGVFEELNARRLAQTMSGNIVPQIRMMTGATPTSAPAAKSIIIQIQGNVIGEEEWLTKSLIPAIEDKIRTKEADFTRN
ncbi:MAG: hypothetical protein JSU85_09395 [Candidatus Zixiibacteriota bacterium]|nr:MAG: hypothetical protein JSU85_09395 [candidate division Zixibacteria bacterium]